MFFNGRILFYWEIEGNKMNDDATMRLMQWIFGTFDQDIYTR